MITLMKYKYVIRQIYVASSSNFACFLFGINFAFATNVIYQLEKANVITKDDNSDSLIGGSGFLLSFIGSAIGGGLQDKYGRKMSLYQTYILNIIGWFIIAAFRSLLIGRYVLSLAAGTSLLSVVYTTEVSDPKFRSLLALSSSLYELGGTCSVNVLLYFFSWEMTTIGLCVFSVILFVNTFFIPETPYWLVMENEKSKAKKIIIWLRGDFDTEHNIDTEIQNISDTVCQFDNKKQTFCDVICNLKNWKIFLLLGLFKILVLMIGYDMITLYCVQFFDKFNNTGIDSRVLTIICSILSFVGVSIGICFLEKFDRKVVLNFSNSINGLFLGIAAFQLTFFPNSTYSSFIAVMCIEGYHVLIQVGTIYLPWTIISECLPNESRGALYALLTSKVLLVVYIVSLVFPIILANVPVIYILWVFCLFSIISVCYVHYVIPETRGKVMGGHLKK